LAFRDKPIERPSILAQEDPNSDPVYRRKRVFSPGT
jgi:hypothetical protein